MSDQDWISFGAASDETWYARIELEFGLNARGRWLKTPDE